MPPSVPSVPSLRGSRDRLRERGSATLEHVGAPALTGLLVGAFTLTMVASGGSLAFTVCQSDRGLLPRGPGTAASSRTPVPFPRCTGS